MRILEDGKTTGHRLGVGEITIPPGTAGSPQHRHAQHDEGFYVVSAPYTFANLGEEPVVLLNTFTPDLYVRYFRDLGQMIADGQPLTPESTEQAMSRYATETLS